MRLINPPNSQPRSGFSNLPSEGYLVKLLTLPRASFNLLMHILRINFGADINLSVSEQEVLAKFKINLNL